MSGRLKYQNTYLPYTGGIDPKLLRVGTLVLDLYNPTEGKETDRFEFFEDITQAEYETKIKTLPGRWERIEGKRSLNFSASREWGIAAGLVDLAHGGANADGEIHVNIEGGRFRRIEMQKPVKFLEETVLKQPKVADWIRKKTTAAWYTRLYHKMDGSVESIKTPKLWICTGVQLISNAKVTSGASTGSGQDAGLKVDPALLTTGVPSGQTVAEIDAHRNSDKQVESEYEQEEELVWAAKFFSLRIKYTNPDEVQAAAEEGAVLETKTKGKALTVMLHEVEDLGAGGVREDVPEINSGEEETGRKAAEVDGLDRPVGGRYPAESQADEDGSSIFISDAPYAKAMDGIEWETFGEYNTYVDTLED